MTKHIVVGTGSGARRVYHTSKTGPTAFSEKETDAHQYHSLKFAEADAERLNKQQRDRMPKGEGQIQAIYWLVRPVGFDSTAVWAANRERNKKLLLDALNLCETAAERVTLLKQYHYGHVYEPGGIAAEIIAVDECVNIGNVIGPIIFDAEKVYGARRTTKLHDIGLQPLVSFKTENETPQPNVSQIKAAERFYTFDLESRKEMLGMLNHSFGKHGTRATMEQVLAAQGVKAEPYGIPGLEPDQWFVATGTNITIVDRETDAAITITAGTEISALKLALEHCGVKELEQ